ncbi:MAG: heavy-metal-associated domain-containing protein [Tannerella sp.]|jgi:Cu(I)/Ag(I) efflux system membrane fusion protein|nr:heavy-metal-associated domain-containing protein [Tannerella sp.]
MKKTVYSVVVAAFLLGTGNAQACPEIRPDERTGVLTGLSAGDTHAHLHVKGSCEMCKTRIEKAAKKVKGVTSVSWNKNSRMLHVNYDPAKTSLEAVSKAVAKAGHDTEKDQAKDKTYQALPQCCKYRK